MEKARKVVFFDGGCALCSAVVQWTHRRDKGGEIWFAALESDFANQFRQQLSLPTAGAEAETFVFWDRDQEIVAEKSDGALLLLKNLGSIWRALGHLGSAVPRFFRNKGYDFIACNRRKWFGTNENCELPSASLREKILQ